MNVNIVNQTTGEITQVAGNATDELRKVQKEVQEYLSKAKL